MAEIVMQIRCVHCLREQYAPAVYGISYGQDPCAWCGKKAPVFKDYPDYWAELERVRHRRRDCVNPWCRGDDDGGCGRTPQEHLEQGLTFERWAGKTRRAVEEQK